MQTFLPFADFRKSAELLDKRRCWKQVVEAYQILNVLNGKSEGWKNHPAVKMWRGYELLLEKYYNTFYQYCVTYHKIKANKLQPIPLGMHKYFPYPTPFWLGTPTFHQSHINNLARKAIEDLRKGRSELYINMKQANLDPQQQNYNGEYIWPV